MKHLNLLFFMLCLWSCTKQKKPITEISANFERASAFNEKGHTDSAFYYFFKAKDLAVIQKDSLMIGKCIVNLAIIATNKRDDLVGQEYSLDALSYLDKRKKENHTYLSYNYNNLGKACQNLRDYDEAVKFYDLAIKFSDNPENINVFLNNKAYLFQETKQYKKAILVYELIQKNKTQNQIEYARALANISFTKWLLNSNYQASSELLNSLSIREKENDSWGKNSSYYYLSEYYEKSRPDSALFYANKMYEVAKELNSSDDKLYALQKLIRLSPTQLKNHYFEQYIKIDDSALTIRNKDKHQFALIRYRSKKNGEENFKLQKDNEEKKYQLLLLISGTILLSAVGLIWYKKRKQRLKLEAENAIRESQLKTSKKVHDKVANKIYRVMSEVENKDDLDRNHLLDQLEHIYNTSRDISYEITDSQQSRTFSQQLSAMFSAYISNTRSVEVINNDDELWANVPENKKAEIFIILLELMTNVKKHSQATSVKIRFDKSEHIISINYHDNGTGLPKNVVYNNGLKNTETRIKNISGTITFESTNKSGLEILISFAAN